MARRRTAERGESNLGCILWLVLLGIAVLISWKMIPVKVNSAELSDYMVEVAQFQSARNAPNVLKQMILNRAAELGIPLAKENVTVTRTGDRIRMTVDYTVPVVFPGYTYNWHFRHELDRPI
ncbi:MAG TPA: hypothetical protein VK899_05560, partial [Gemmatimonadales bacterium]|nr:hypothetical protein [Gemmatimonadales bacterium]